MYTKTSVFRLYNSLKSSAVWVPVKHIYYGGRPKPVKITYYKVYELDKVVDFMKDSSLIFTLKSIIQSQKTRSLPLRDLEKEVGFVKKWDFMALIEKYPSIFFADSGYRIPAFVKLTKKAEEIAVEESRAMELMEPILVTNLRKLLMLSVDSKIPLRTIKLIQYEMGLPRNFELSLIPKYPEFFSLKLEDSQVFVHLVNWDCSIAVTAREAKLARKGIYCSDKNPFETIIDKNGNYPGPHSFELRFPVGFRRKVGLRKGLKTWQKMDFPSPYNNAKMYDLLDRSSRKRVVGMVHELCSLTMEKRLSSAQVEAFRKELYFPSSLIAYLLKHQGIFYITNQGQECNLFLKEAYDGSRLIETCPILEIKAKFLALAFNNTTTPMGISYC